jgi:F-type H+-transporting ATPase subunit alpha
VEKQILIIFAGINGYLTDQPLPTIKALESRLYLFMDEKHPELLQQIRSKGTLDEALEAGLHSAIDEFKQQLPKVEAIVK